MLFAVNNLGRIQNSPNFLFLRNDFKTYTADKGSKTLIILDAYLPFVVDYLQPAGIKNVIITNLKDYLPEKHFNNLIVAKEIYDSYSNKKELSKVEEKVFTKVNDIYFDNISFFRIY